MSAISTFSLKISISRNFPQIIQASASIHTSSTCQSRIKRVHNHKPFFHIKKTAKHPDEPISYENKSFIQDMIEKRYSIDPLGTYVRPEGHDSNISGSPLRPDLQPWPRQGWDEYGTKSKRCGLLARKIGVVPMWFNNGKRVAATMLQVRIVSQNILFLY